MPTRHRKRCQWSLRIAARSRLVGRIPAEYFIGVPEHDLGPAARVVSWAAWWREPRAACIVLNRRFHCSRSHQSCCAGGPALDRHLRCPGTLLVDGVGGRALPSLELPPACPLFHPDGVASHPREIPCYVSPPPNSACSIASTRCSSRATAGNNFNFSGTCRKRY